MMNLMLLIPSAVATLGAHVACIATDCSVTLAAPFHKKVHMVMTRCSEEQYTLCAETDIGKSHVKLCVNPSTSSFYVEAIDEISNVYPTTGSLLQWSSWEKARRLSMDTRGRRLNVFGYDDVEYGRRSDCTQEDCPERWTNCFSASNALVEVSVVVFLEQTFCDHFSKDGDITRCLRYVEGVFRDTNLVYESQLGVHLTLGYIVPPEVVAKEFPKVNNPFRQAGQDYLSSIANAWGGDREPASPCATAEAFKRVTGFEYDQFGLAHAFFGAQEVAPGGRLNLGLAWRDSLCSCDAVAWTAYAFDAPGTETWLTFAHEVGHIFGARHFSNGTEPVMGDINSENSGIMGYAGGKVEDVFQFHQSHREEICAEVAKAVEKYPTCFHPYLQPAERDSRYNFTLLAIIMGVLVCSNLLCCIALVWTKFAKREPEHTDFVQPQMILA